MYTPLKSKHGICCTMLILGFSMPYLLLYTRSLVLLLYYSNFKGISNNSKA